MGEATRSTIERVGMDKYLDIKNKLLEFAAADDAIKAVVAIGSTTRKDVKADEFSDLDLFIVTDDTDKWFYGEYPDLLGNISISFIEPTLGGGMERRCMYEDFKDVDFIAMTPEQFETVVKDGVASWVMNRGYEVLYDSISCQEFLKTYINSEIVHPYIDEEEFKNVVNDFYFHNIWSYKKLKRGEIWAAKTCVDDYLKKPLLRMIELYRYKTAGVDTWHEGRFFDKWAGEEIICDMKKCFAHYDADDIYNSLVETHKLFAKVTEDLAKIEGFVYPKKARDCARLYLKI